MRLGVGHPGEKELVHDYVLHDFAKDERAWLDPLLEASRRSDAAAGRAATSNGFMNKVDDRREPAQAAAEARDKDPQPT